MCQLIGCNLNNHTLNSLFLASMLQIDSLNNVDGTGFLSVSKETYEVWKTEEEASTIEDLGKLIKDRIKSNYPVIGHVRAASKGIKVTEENAHPFDGKRFVLAHNGRLYDNDEVVTYSAVDGDTSLASDSQKFLERLDKAAKDMKNASIVELLNKSMEDFKGKFAFLIYDKVKDKHYAVRGSSADLHYVELFKVTKNEKDEMEWGPCGYLVNTKKDSLSNAIGITLPIAQIVSGKDIRAGKITELETNSIYEFGRNKLTKIGDIKEKATYTQSASSTVHQNMGGRYSAMSNNSSTKLEVNLNVPVVALVNQIQEFMKKNFFTIEDIDNLFIMFLKMPMADASLHNLQEFVDIVIPMVCAPKKVRQRLRAAMNSESARVWPTIYSQVKGLQYPWTLSGQNEINSLITFFATYNKRK